MSETAPTDPIRSKVDEWISGIRGVKDGTYDVFFIEVAVDGRFVAVTPDNARACEDSVRNAFAEEYPDLFAEVAA